MTPEQVVEYSALIGEPQDPTYGIAIEWSHVFGFMKTLENFMSEAESVTLDALEPDDSDKVGAYDAAGTLLMDGGEIQPHLAGALADSVSGGKSLSSRFYRDAACLVTAIFECTTASTSDAARFTRCSSRTRLCISG